MPIGRTSTTPRFLDYVTRYALLPNHNQANVGGVGALISEFIDVPKFQRGIAWDNDSILEFLSSSSVLIGNVIMGQFDLSIDDYPDLQNITPHYYILIDGLQRLSVGTIILKVLHECIFANHAPFLHEIGRFHRININIQGAQTVFLYNHDEFINHPRTAIKDAYSVLYNEFRDYLTGVLEDGTNEDKDRLAGQINSIFLDRQVAIDIYFNFQDRIQIMNTFLGINTIRLDLSTIDLVRSFIIEKAEISDWDDLQIEHIENRFTEVFTNQNGTPDGKLFPFVGVILEVFRQGRHSILFPSWDQVLDFNEIENFINFVENFKVGGQTIENPFIKEIMNTGSAPYAILIAVYYYKYITNNNSEPTFFMGGNLENSDLHRFLVSCYRATIEGGVGKSRRIAENIFIKADINQGANRPYQNDQFPKTMELVAEEMSYMYSGFSLDMPYNLQYLFSLLNKVNKSNSKLVFNAMLLPLKAQGWGSDFTPITFGKSTRRREFNVDHLIPDSMKDSSIAGFDQIDKLRNLAPLPCNVNRDQRDNDCSFKLGNGGPYENYISTPYQPGNFIIHPYCQWIVAHAQTKNPADLDDQSQIDRGAQIGDERINHIASELILRL